MRDTGEEKSMAIRDLLAVVDTSDCDEQRHFADAPYENIDVVDRIGSGDAYVAGALYGILAHGTIEAAARHGDAMSALKNTIPGDMTICSLDDLQRIMDAHEKGASGEMVR